MCAGLRFDDKLRNCGVCRVAVAIWLAVSSENGKRELDACVSSGGTLDAVAGKNGVVCSWSKDSDLGGCNPN